MSSSKQDSNYCKTQGRKCFVGGHLVRYTPVILVHQALSSVEAALHRVWFTRGRHGRVERMCSDKMLLSKDSQKSTDYTHLPLCWTTVTSKVRDQNNFLSAFIALSL